MEGLTVSSHVTTLKLKVEQLLTQKQLISDASGNKQTAVSGLLAVVQLNVLVSKRGRTILNIQRLSCLLKEVLDMSQNLPYF